MRNFYLLLALFCAVSFTGLGQDTLNSYPGANKVYNYQIALDGDTSVHTYAADSTLEAVKKMKGNSITHYTRYYPNGAVMWTKEFTDNQATGNFQIFGDDSKLLGAFVLKNDTIVDTTFIHKRRRFIYGRFTYYSVVHGGMMRPDGTSNVSGGYGVQMHYPMYAVKQNMTAEKQEVFQEFHTDYNGYFLLEVPSGKYGIFPQYFAIDRVTAKMGCPEYKSSAMQTSWSYEGPIDMTDKNYCYLFYYYHSVGYAP